MQCAQCHSENPDHAKFCLECAAPFRLRCPSCGTDLPPTAKFCLECAPPVTRAATERDPRAYTPKHLADKILTSRSALEGERKQVTVLFADVKGSMELAEQVDPEEWHPTRLPPEETTRDRKECLLDLANTAGDRAWLWTRRCNPPP